jgi:methionine sulfoxide reductase heme-binding subunit
MTLPHENWAPEGRERMNCNKSRFLSAPLPAMSLLVSTVILAGLPFGDLRTASGTEFMVVYSVRCALAFFLVAFTASSMAVLWPNVATRWILRNRRAFGLTFSVGMGWHLSFVIYFFEGFHKHLNRLDVGLDLLGLAFLIALTVTSFRRVARHLSLRTWQSLHRVGVYAIWSLATYIYVLDMKYNRNALHVVALALLVCAASLRVTAFRRKSKP